MFVVSNFFYIFCSIQLLFYFQKKYEEIQIELENIIKENTSKLDLLVVLTRERSHLEQEINSQKRRKLHIASVVDVAYECRDDIQKLATIVKNQKKHLQVNPLEL